MFEFKMIQQIPQGYNPVGRFSWIAREADDECVTYEVAYLVKDGGAYALVVTYADPDSGVHWHPPTYGDECDFAWNGEYWVEQIQYGPGSFRVDNFTPLDFGVKSGKQIFPIGEGR